MQTYNAWDVKSKSKVLSSHPSIIYFRLTQEQFWNLSLKLINTEESINILSFADFEFLGISFTIQWFKHILKKFKRSKTSCIQKLFKLDCVDETHALIKTFTYVLFEQNKRVSMFDGS